MALAMMYCDLVYQLPAVGLRGADLMSMMWNIEVRSALIRRPVLELALNLPLRAKIDRASEDLLLRTKVLLKRLSLRHYPRALLAEKQGFAGFPNEPAAYLGDPADFLADDVVGIPRSQRSRPLSRAAAWKLANVEFFLRNSPDVLPASRPAAHASAS